MVGVPGLFLNRTQKPVRSFRWQGRYFFLAVQSFLKSNPQTKINQKENQFRQRENILFEEYLQNPKNLQNLEKVINNNFSQTYQSF